VQQNYAEAVDWYRKAADAGDSRAQTTLGLMYYDGQGVTQDYVESVRWYRKAADAGNADAQAVLGTSYEEGEGVTQDYAEAARWYRKAADAGHPRAQSFLGYVYFRGQGVPQDYVLAHMWYNLAASNSNGEDQKQWAEMRDDVAKKLTPQQLGRRSGWLGSGDPKSKSFHWDRCAKFARSDGASFPTMRRSAQTHRAAHTAGKRRAWDRQTMLIGLVSW